MLSSVLELAFPLFVVALAACGSANTTSASPSAGSSSAGPSSSSAVSGPGADAICANYNTQINAIPAPPNPDAPADASALPAIASWLDTVLVAAQREQSALKATPDAASINAPFAEVITTLRGADTAAKGGDLNAYKAEFVKFSAANSAFHTMAGQSNLANCAK